MRDTEAEIMIEICRYVKTEPAMLPLDKKIDRSGNVKKKISGIGV